MPISLSQFVKRLHGWIQFDIVNQEVKIDIWIKVIPIVFVGNDKY